MTIRAYLGLDIGGTGAKAAVFAEDGRRLGAGHVTYAPTISAQGFAEINIECIYSAARDATRQAVQQSGVPIRALAIATQGQTFVALDADDQPLYPAILWYDARAAHEAEHLKAALTADGTEAEHPFVEAIASAPKILWLRAHQPDAMSRARRYLLLPDYLTYRLTGEAVTDPCTASTTALYADGAAGYSAAALRAAQIMPDQLARIQPPGTFIASVRADVAEAWGLSSHTPVSVITGTNDQYAGALGAGNYRPGIVTETTGTCLALVSLFEAATASPLAPGLMGGRFPIPGYSFALAYAKTAGLIVDWFMQEMGAGKTRAELEALAAASPPGSRGITVIPHFDGMVSPQPNAAARGALMNLSLHHTLGDMYRAVLESIAFSLRENLELMQSSGLSVGTLRSIGGGARSDLWCQIKADVTGMPVERPAVTEAATLGAAMLAAVGAGAFASLAECSAAFYRAEYTFVPDTQRHALYEAPYHAYRSFYQSLYGTGSRLAAGG
jgi:xylulokinase